MENIGDRDGQKLNSQIIRQLAGVRAASFGGIWAGHGYAKHVFAAQGCHGNGGHDGGIDASAEANYYGAEAGLANVVARSADERLEDKIELGGGLRVNVSRVCFGVKKDEVFHKGACLGGDSAVGQDNDAV